jgi:aminoglycoside phosphotransferase (APT) family kinase protein
VHGDYRVGNFLQSNGHITAILDWELVHLGDPHEDLAWAGLRVFAGGSPRIGGLVEREMFYSRYAQRTGFTLIPQVLRFYEVLGLFKSAAMLVGAVHRIETGQARDIRMASMGFQLTSTLLEINRLIAEAP